MGWKGTLRSINAAAKQAERSEARRQRELVKRHKQIEKMEALELAQYEVEVYENYIERLVSVHKEASPPIIWKNLIVSDDNVPLKDSQYEVEAQNNLRSFCPSFFDKIFRRIDRKRKALEEKVDQGKKKDEKEYQDKLNLFQKLKEESEIARKILKRNKGAFSEAIDYFFQISRCAEISELGSSVKIKIYDEQFVTAQIHICGEDVIPTEAKMLLKSGKLSEKKIPIGKRNELYQDYVCSCVIRVANEIFSILPIDMIVITAIDELLNSSTGHKEKLPILSVAISKSTLGNLNLDTIDPSDSMKNFVHNMNFKKASGFDSVEELDITHFL